MYDAEIMGDISYGNDQFSYNYHPIHNEPMGRNYIRDDSYPIAGPSLENNPLLPGDEDIEYQNANEIEKYFIKNNMDREIGNYKAHIQKYSPSLPQVPLQSRENIPVFPSLREHFSKRNTSRNFPMCQRIIIMFIIFLFIAILIFKHKNDEKNYELLKLLLVNMNKNQ